MWTSSSSLNLLILISLAIVKTQADSSACEQKEKNLVALDLAKESISKAKELQPACFNDSSNSSECGAKEKVSAYLDFARNLIDEAKENYTTCDPVKNLTRVVLLHKKPADCLEILENGDNISGEYTIWPRHRIFDGKPLRVYCDMETDGGGWTVIQRRGNFSDRIDFHRNWTEYKYGFGNISEEFWIGNDHIFALTNQGNNTARFDMENVNSEYRYAIYYNFWIEDEKAGYMLHFGDYNGTAGDGIRDTNNMEFSTKDRKYSKSNTECPTLKMGGWWYNNCGLGNPNGINPSRPENGMTFIHWHPWMEYDSLLTIEIKIRSKT